MSDTFTKGMNSGASELLTGVRKCLWQWNAHSLWEEVKKNKSDQIQKSCCIRMKNKF